MPILAPPISTGGNSTNIYYSTIGPNFNAALLAYQDAYYSWQSCLSTAALNCSTWQASQITATQAYNTMQSMASTLGATPFST